MDIPLFPEHFSDLKGIQRILAYDRYHRKTQRWPLVEFENFDNFRTRDPQVNQKVYVHRADLDSFVWKIPSQELFDDAGYFALQTILEKHKGKIVVAGGSVARILTDAPSICRDVDIFFHGVASEEAEEILIDCIITIIKEHNKVDELITQPRIERHLNVTNVVIDQYTTYQFIHRIYPRKDLIIGGFDIGPSMVLYDGENTYATFMGAWSLAKRSIIVDTTRRSTSFEYRIVKYHDDLNFNVVFPGFGKFVFEEDKKYQKLSDYIKKLEQKLQKKIKELDLCSIQTGSVFIDESNFIEGIECKPYSFGYEGKLRMTNQNIYVKAKRGTSPTISDYCSTKLINECMPEVNCIYLINNKLESVFACKEFIRIPNKDDLKYFIDNPEVCLGEDFEKLIYYKLQNAHTNRKIRHVFAGYADRVIQGCPVDIDEVHRFLCKRVGENKIRSEKLLQEIKWIEQNPQRQWTSSINPIVKHPRDFYGERYRPFTIGIPEEVETLLRLARLRNPLWISVSRDIFNIILKILFFTCAWD